MIVTLSFVSSPQRRGTCSDDAQCRLSAARRLRPVRCKGLLDPQPVRSPIVPVKIARARCQPGIANVFATISTQGVIWIIGAAAQHALAGCRGTQLLVHRMPDGSGQVVGTHRTFSSLMTNKKSRRGRTPTGIPPRRLTRHRAPRPSRVALHLVIRQTLIIRHGIENATGP